MCIRFVRRPLPDSTQHNTIQYNTTRHDTTRHDTTRHDTTRHDTTRHDTTRHDTTRHDTTRHDTTRHDTTRHDTTRHDTTRHQHPEPHVSVLHCFSMLGSECRSEPARSRSGFLSIEPFLKRRGGGVRREGRGSSPRHPCKGRSNIPFVSGNDDQQCCVNFVCTVVKMR